MNTITLQLYAIDEALATAWEAAFAGVSRVEVRRGSILDHDPSRDAPAALVSPANSFGYMDGGLDLIYSTKLGWHIEQRVRAALLADWDGELPVGCAIIVPTDRADFPHMISAPTMRVPMNVAETAHAFLALRAALRAVLRHNERSATPITTIRCPGMGTGEGRMSASRAARQMRRAWDVVIDGEVVTRGGLAGAVRDHLWLLERDE